MVSTKTCYQSTITAVKDLLMPPLWHAHLCVSLSLPPCIRQEKRAQRLSFWIRRPPGGVGVFHAKGWWPKTSCPPSKLCLPWVSKRGIWDAPGILAGCPGALGAFKKFSAKNVCAHFSFHIVVRLHLSAPSLGDDLRLKLAIRLRGQTVHSDSFWEIGCDFSAGMSRTPGGVQKSLCTKTSCAFFVSHHAPPLISFWDPFDHCKSA